MEIIVNIENYESGKTTYYYIVISFKDSDDPGLVNEYKFEPIDQLNISRKVIVKQLRLKTYSVIDET